MMRSTPYHLTIADELYAVLDHAVACEGEEAEE